MHDIFTQKLVRVVTFTKYLASVVSLISLAKTLMWNKITFLASNLLNLAELLINEPVESICKKLYQYLFFYPIYHCSHRYNLWLIMNYQSSNFWGEGSWNKNFKKNLKAEISLNTQMIFLWLVNLNVVQKSEKVKLYL